MHPLLRRLRRAIEPLLGIAAALLLWERVGRQVANATLVPMPAMVWNAFVAMMADDLPKDILANLALKLARQLAPDGVTVNNLSPGLVVTARNQYRRVDAVQWQSITHEANPMHRAGTPEEMAGAALLLCSDAGSFITGTDLQVSGGAQL